MLKGFMIFFTATFWFVSWSRAELCTRVCQRPATQRESSNATRRGSVPHQTESAHANWLEIRVPVPGVSVDGRRRAGRHGYLEVISKVVPKICARTNSAMLTSFEKSTKVPELSSIPLGWATESGCFGGWDAKRR